MLFYLSTQPSYYAVIVDGIGHSPLAAAPEGAWRRLIVEKPFGHDLASARELNARIHAVFREEDTYRIDHYLGKETVQNILAFRFGNGIFEPLWNRRYVNHVQITAAESIGVEGRGALLPGSRRAARHDPESPAAGDGDGRHGAVGGFRARRGARRARQAAALDQDHAARRKCRSVRGRGAISRASARSRA